MGPAIRRERLPDRHHGAVTATVFVVDPPGVARAVEACWSTALVRDRDGREGRGFLNLKRLLGSPAEFRRIIEELAKTVPPGVAVAAADKGAWALVGALVVELGAPGVLVRPDPKEHFVAYGDDPALADARLAGERLDEGTRVHLIDDVIYSGETLRSAGSVLRSAGLDVREASVIVGASSAESIQSMLTSSGLERASCLVLATQLDLPAASWQRP